MLRRSEVLLACSAIANAILVVVLILRGRDDGRRQVQHSPDAAYCDVVKADLDFFIEGLEKNNDPFYSPIAVRTMGRLLPTCFPEQKAQIDAWLADLRHHLLILVAENPPQDQKRQSHDSALKLFRELRALYGSSF